MKNISPKHRILDHIENVRDWLNRAEDGYKRGASVQGEMNLNLAQAELKKAWEESRNMHQEAKAASKVIPLSRSQQPSVAVRPVAANKRGSSLVQHRFGLVAAVVLLLMINLVPLLQGLSIGQAVRTDASPVNELPMGALTQSSEGIISSNQAMAQEESTNAEQSSPALNSFTADAQELAYGDQGDATMTEANRTTPQSAMNGITGDAKAQAKATRVEATTQSTDSGNPFRYDGKNGQTAKTPVKEVRSEEKSTESINRTVALNAKALRSSGNRVDKLLTSGTTGTVQVVTDSTPARATGSGLAITATDAATNTANRTSDLQNANLAMSQAAVSTDEMPVNVNTTWSTGPSSFSYNAYSPTSGSSSQSTASSIAKSGVKSGTTASNAAVVTFDFDALVDLATQALYTNQH